MLAALAGHLFVARTVNVLIWKPVPFTTMENVSEAHTLRAAHPSVRDIIDPIILPRRRMFKKNGNSIMRRQEGATC